MKKDSGIFLELGGRDGLVHSNSLFFERCLGWRGLLIEGKKQEFADLCTNRPSSVAYNMAVGCTNWTTVPWIGESEGTAGIASTLPKVFISRYHKLNKLYNVTCGPLGEVLIHAGISHIDLLSLDVEGAERRVLESMDWSVPVGIIMYEAVWLPRNDDIAIQEMLKVHGFKFHSCTRGCNNKIFLGPHSPWFV